MNYSCTIEECKPVTVSGNLLSKFLKNWLEKINISGAEHMSKIK